MSAVPRHRRGTLAKRCAMHRGIEVSPFDLSTSFGSPPGSISPVEIFHERRLHRPTIAAEEIADVTSQFTSSVSLQAFWHIGFHQMRLRNLPSRYRIRFR